MLISGGGQSFYNLPPSSYEVQVREPGFDSSVTVVKLNAAETKTVDLTLKSQPPQGNAGFYAAAEEN
jgi:hypothetical protein